MDSHNGQIGKRVKLISSTRENLAVRPGDVGVVWRITRIGTWRVLWDNGNRCDLNPKTERWEILDDANGGDPQEALLVAQNRR
jgi:hypothetical protein